MGMSRKSIAGWVMLIAAVIGIRIFSLFTDAVERYYSTGIYPYLARVLRILFGWIPFSVGDVLYAIAGVYLLVSLVKLCSQLFRRKKERGYFTGVLKSLVRWTLLIYLVFNLFWGLNYNRKGIAYQLQLDVKPYTTGELAGVLQVIVQRLNQCDSAARIGRTALMHNRRLFDDSDTAYHLLASQNAIFGYPSPSVKSSLFGYPGDYLGFTGYYNPFSGEAQVNTTVPVYVLPFTTCHEIGHQLGYAKENEANFAGYLSARSSPDPAFHYSAYFDLYYYAARELFVRDSNLLKLFRAQLKPDIRKDFRDLQNFYRKYENPFEPYIRALYGKYLKANEQPQGLMSYNEVIAWLIAYYKKYGPEAV